ncbi:MAG: hypothetical protein AVO33_00175 [delta proteobacterium ML8_F1]|nr:MAG: hypothetical protein AVO33_00175 [delta proteobacterium ML8_F1]
MGKKNIVILGMGTVGMGFVNTYLMNRETIEGKLGGPLDIRKVLVSSPGKKRPVDLPGDRYTGDFNDLNLEDADVVVELMGGVEPAFTYIKQAIERGCHVVSANKELMAKRGDELIRLADEKGVLLRYEASVGGGIPLINTITDGLASNRVIKMMGILNGTTNYILTRMTRDRISYEEALGQAKSLGFAEADPTADVEGFDAAYKLAILSRDAFGVVARPEEITRQGIKEISLEDIEYGLELGYKIKLLALGEKKKEHVELSVQPALISVDHPVASVNQEFNALFVEGNSLGEIMLYGKGAGGMPTGSAVMTDVMEILINGRKTIGSCKEKKMPIKNIGLSPYYVRMEVLDSPGVLGQIAMIFGEQGISLDSVVQRAKGSEVAPLVFITHDVKRECLDRALEEIEAREYVLKIQSILKVVR